jgi:hypothetical protein
MKLIPADERRSATTAGPVGGALTDPEPVGWTGVGARDRPVPRTALRYMSRRR